ncbi:MAG TPA: M56 family metallopeptidase [Terriglobales bacterium]|nr:M56 family metallopeptidase [Terriglobales bacterium]
MIPALANHLWQSTAFAAAAALLSLAFRKNRAHVRYWLWAAASVKFLVPFSLLVDLGTRVNWAPATQAAAAQAMTPAISFAAERATQPFLAMPELAPAVSFSHWAIVALIGIWGCGVLAIAAMRVRAWNRIRAAIRASTPVETLPVAGLDVRSTPGRLEPGVVGVLRPVLLLPAGIVERLTPPQLEAILAHEACHARRRDNFFAMLHMVVEALFWFYPPVWWIGARMVHERERACDESVLALGGEPCDYAGAIVSVCKFYVESPLGCVAGISGADVRRRIEAIMQDRRGRSLGFGKRWLLACATVVALAGPAVVGLVIGLGHAPVVYAQAKPQNAGALPQFTVASVEPSAPNERVSPAWQRDSGYWSAPRTTVVDVIGYAFRVSSFNNILGAPGWVYTTRYDFQARMPPGTSEAQFRLMLQSLLADRFQLKAHIEMRPRDVAIMTAGPAGPDLHPASRNCVPPPSHPNGTLGLAKVSPMELAGCSVSMAALADFFTVAAVHPVIDETGLKGLYDIDVTINNPPTFRGESRNEITRGGALATEAAFHKQLGLNLDLTKLVKRPMPVLVIDHLAPASAN